MGPRLPRLATLRYKPDISVEWDGKKAHFYRHEDRKFTPPVAQIPGLVLEWLYYRVRLLLRIALLVPLRIVRHALRDKARRI